MIRLILPILLLLLICVPVPLAAQTSGAGFVVFVHTGKIPKDHAAVRLVASALVQRGFAVRAPDNDTNYNLGPGVEYFSDSAADAAQQVATLVNELFGKAEVKEQLSPLRLQEASYKLTPRRIKVPNPTSYIGLWLF